MARPPIIVSNGGIRDKLAKGCGAKTTDAAVATQIMQNIEDLAEDEAVAMVIKNNSGNSKTPCLYWRLSTDTPYGKNQNKEGASINDVVDET